MQGVALFEGSLGYAVPKAALIHAARLLAKEQGGPANVRVNVVAPGYVTGEALDRLFATAASRRGRPMEEIRAEAAGQAALHRFVEPDDVAEAVLFLASGRSAGITGVVLDVNAGSWIG
jgi:NAD(P)-dependent dehydrogenase (short-subunit alcohol dehydrogenase family)